MRVFCRCSVYTLLGLLHPPEKVAAGCVAVASRLLGVQLQDVAGRPWWQALYLPSGAPLALGLDELGGAQYIDSAIKKSVT